MSPLPRMLIAGCLLLAAPAFALGDDPARRAVLVGINAYQHERLPDLRFAEADVEALAKVLKEGGYEVTLMTGSTKDANLVPTKANIERHIKAALESCKKGDLALVAFAGHGLQFDGKGDSYFCPVDARPFSDKTDTLVSLGLIYREFESSFAGMKVLLVDACRNNPELESGRGARSGITADGAIRPPAGVAALFSCSAGERAFEHDSLKHGIFFRSVLDGFAGKALNSRGQITFARLSAHVKEEVPDRVSSLIGGSTKQSPNLKADYSNEPLLVDGRGSDASYVEYIEYTNIESFDNRLTWLQEKAPARLKIWRREAEGDNSASQFLTARAFSEGIGVLKDMTEAARWYRKAADAGNSCAMFYLGFCYMNGTGVSKDEAEAVMWLRKAADAGHAYAMWNLGLCYTNGTGVSKDEAEAARWHRKAADAGQPDAMFYLGFCYMNGTGVSKDEAEAVMWLRKAADAGHAYAMWNLGLCYTNGTGVSKDEAEAARWYRKAANEGSEYAKRALKELGEG